MNKKHGSEIKKASKLLVSALMVGALFSASAMADSTTVSNWSEFQTAVNNYDVTTINVNADITYADTVNNIGNLRNLSIIGSTVGKFLNGTNGSTPYKGFIVDSGGALNINALTMKGFSSDNGGAIYNNGTISITGATDTEGNIVAFEGNTASINGGALSAGFRWALGKNVTNGNLKQTNNSVPELPKTKINLSSTNK